MTNQSVAGLVNWLNTLSIFAIPVIDKTRFNGKMDITFSGKLNSIAEIRKELQRWNLDLIESIEELDMFVLKEK